MAALPLTLHLDEGDHPHLREVFYARSTERVIASTRVQLEHGTLQVIAAPRDLRNFAQALLDVADEACRQEDRLTDEPLPGIAS